MKRDFLMESMHADELARSRETRDRYAAERQALYDVIARHGILASAPLVDELLSVALRFSNPSNVPARKP